MHGVLLYQTNNNGDTKANIVKKKKNHRYRRYFIDVNIYNLMGDIFLLIT